MSRALTLAATLVACVLIATAFRAVEIQLESVDSDAAVRSTPQAARPPVPPAASQAAPKAAPVAVEARRKPHVRDVVAVDIDRYLPASLVKPFDRDFEETRLLDFLNEVSRMTGLVTRAETEVLKNAGVPLLESKVTARSKGIPAYVALGRALYDVNGVRLDWAIRDQMLVISTVEAMKEQMESESIDVSSLLEAGSSFPSLMNLTKEMVDTQWQDDDGEGGEMTPMLKSLHVLNTFQANLQARCLLDGLHSRAYKTELFTSPLDRQVELALEKTISPQFVSQPLKVVVQELSKELGIEIDLDQTELTAAGVTADSEITLVIESKPFQAILNVLLESVNGVKLAAVVSDGRLLIMPYDESEDVMRVAAYRLPRLTRRFDFRSLARLLKSQTSEDVNWMDEDGEGGELNSPLNDVVVIRQTESGFREIDAILARVLKDAVEHPVVSPDPDAVEIRRTPMLTSKARDLARIIPKMVAPGHWGRLPDGTEALIEPVTLTAEVHSRAKAEGKTGAFSEVEQVSEGHSMLLIRQTRAVQDQIDRFIREQGLEENRYGGMGFGY